MGAGESTDSDKEGTKDIQFENNDKSIIYSIIQILYNLKEFKKYISEKDFPQDCKKPLNMMLKRIFKKSESKINLDKYSRKIHKIINKNYRLDIGETAGKILIQILELLNYEENGNKITIWEESLKQNPQFMKNTYIQMEALKDFEATYKQNNDTQIAKFFQGTLLNRRVMQNPMNSCMNFFSYFSVYEINLTSLYDNLNSMGINLQNLQIKKDEIPLNKCLTYMINKKIEMYNGMPCFSEIYIFNPPQFLIFYVYRASDSKNDDVDVSFSERTDLKEFIVNKNSGTSYDLIGIIKERKIVVKLSVDGTYEDNDPNNKDFPMNKYLAIFKNENKFYYYNNKNKKKEFNLSEKDNIYFKKL